VAGSPEASSRTKLARRIEDAIRELGFLHSLFLHHSVKKRGGFQVEIRFALNCAERIPLDEVFLIPSGWTIAWYRSGFSVKRNMWICSRTGK